jgi:hypothetical protein
MHYAMGISQDGSWRVVIDFRKVNMQVVKESYPLPGIDDTLMSLRTGNKYFSNLDLNQDFGKWLLMKKVNQLQAL